MFRLLCLRIFDKIEILRLVGMTSFFHNFDLLHLLIDGIDRRLEVDRPSAMLRMPSYMYAHSDIDK